MGYSTGNDDEHFGWISSLPSAVDPIIFRVPINDAGPRHQSFGQEAKPICDSWPSRLTRSSLSMIFPRTSVHANGNGLLRAVPTKLGVGTSGDRIEVCLRHHEDPASKTSM